MQSRLIPLAAVAWVTACGTLPPLEMPALPVPARYPVAENSASAPQDGLAWQAQFREPRLQRRIEQALRDNRDLRQAAIRVDAARAALDMRRATRWPAVDATAGVARQGSSNGGTASTAFNVGLDIAAYEIDLFGRLKRLDEEAASNLLATEHARRAVEIALIGSVAEAHVAEQLAREQLDLARRSVEAWEQSRQVTLQLVAGGLAGDLEIAQAHSLAAAGRAEVLAREQALARSRNATALLLGTGASADYESSFTRLEDLEIIDRLSAGTPSDLLLRRPDIAEAEADLRAAHANIGAARAAFFPRVTLTAALGLASPALSGLFSAGAGTWSFAPQVVQPLFDGGRMTSELRLSELRRDAAIAEYERRIQVAFRDVSDSLAGRASLGGQLSAKLDQAGAARERWALLQARYAAGLDSRLELLDGQRSLYAAESELLEVRAECLVNAIRLFAALGGGPTRGDASTHP